MLKLGALTDYRWPVTVPSVAADGTALALEFGAVFRRVPQSRLDEIAAAYRAAAAQTATGPTDAEIVEEVFAGWHEGVLAADDAPAPVTPENRAALLDYPGARTAIVRAWLTSVTDGPRGN